MPQFAATLYKKCKLLTVRALHIQSKFVFLDTVDHKVIITIQTDFEYDESN